MDISEYISKCKEKINYHKNQSINANSWNNAFSLITVLLASCQGFAMTLMTVLNSTAFEVAIVSGVFSVVIVVFSKVKENYQFLSLHYQHSHICEEFTNLHYEFSKNLQDYNNNTLNQASYERSVVKYSVILNKSHIQHINNCRSIFCCLEEYTEELL